MAEGWNVLTYSWNSRHQYISVTHGKVLYMEVTVADDITATSSMTFNVLSWNNGFKRN